MRSSGRLAIARVSASWARWPPESDPARWRWVEVELLDPGLGELVVPVLVEVGAHAEVLGHRQPGVGRGVLGDEADLLEPGSAVAGASAEHRDRSRARREQSDGQVQQRRLARTVRPDEPDDLAFGDGQVAVAERPLAPVPLAEIVRLDDGASCHAFGEAVAERGAVDRLDVVGTETGGACVSQPRGHRRKEALPGPPDRFAEASRRRMCPDPVVGARDPPVQGLGRP